MIQCSEGFWRSCPACDYLVGAVAGAVAGAVVWSVADAGVPLQLRAELEPLAAGGALAGVRSVSAVGHEVRLQVAPPHERLAARAGEGPLARVHARVHRQVAGRAERL